MRKGIFVGLATLDVIHRVQTVPLAGTKIVAQGQMVLVGGPATNAAIAFSGLGTRATVITTLGTHPVANLIRQELEQLSVSYLDINQAFRGAPPISSIFVLPDGSRTVVSANATRIPIVPAVVSLAEMQDASILLVDGHFMESGIAWARQARAQGISVVLDGGSWKPNTEELVKSVDIAICSANFRPPRCESEGDVIAFLAAHGVRKIAITNGEHPVRYVVDDHEGSFPVARVPVVDTLGAGDIFHGAFCAYYTISHDFVQSLLNARTIATESVKYEGTREWMKHIRDAIGIGNENLRLPTRHISAPQMSSPPEQRERPVMKAEGAPSRSIPTPVPQASTEGVSDDERLGIQKKQYDLQLKQYDLQLKQYDLQRRHFNVAIASIALGVWTVVSKLREPQPKFDAYQDIKPTTDSTPHLRADASRWLWRYCFPLPVESVHDLAEHSGRVALVAGVDDRYDPKGPKKFSESGRWVSHQYVDAFQTGKEEVVTEVSQIREDDALVLLASQEVNPLAREYFGEPDKHRPIHSITVGSADARHYTTDLTWAIFTPEDAPYLTILQTSEHQLTERRTQEHFISCSEGLPLRAKPGTLAGHHVWQSDYLLITALPTDETQRRRVISFAGLHRTGTIAAGGLFTHLPYEILREVEEKLSGYPYFQALVEIAVDNRRAEQGLALPGPFLGVEVRPLKIDVQEPPPIHDGLATT